MSIKITSSTLSEKEAQDKFLAAQTYLRQSDLANFLIDELIRVDSELTIKVTTSGDCSWMPPETTEENSAGTIIWNINDTLTVKSDNTESSPAMGLMHEMGHACQFLTGDEGEFLKNVEEFGDHSEAEDINVKAVEQTIAKELNAKGCKEGVRQDYLDHV